MHILALSIPAPSLDASTVAGQFQWFLYGVGYGGAVCTVAMMIRIFRKSSSGSGFSDN